MTGKILYVVLMLALAGAVLGNSYAPILEGNHTRGDLAAPAQDRLKRFSSPEEIKAFLEKNAGQRGYMGGVMEEMAMPMAAPSVMKSVAAAGADTVASSTIAPSSEGGADSFSTTNIQVAGVDEADIVKSDGRYLYVLSRNRVHIIDAYPPEDAGLLSTIDFKGQAQELYINGDRLIVLGNSYSYVAYPPLEEEAGVESLPYPGPSVESATVYVYDVSNRSRPELVKEISVDGAYFDSRMIDDYLYVIATDYNIYYDGEVVMPRISTAAKGVSSREALDVYYFDVPDYSYAYTNIISIDIRGDDPSVKGKTYLLGSTENLFVSQKNIYITYQRWLPEPRPLERVMGVVIEPGRPVPPYESGERTVVHRIAIADGDILYEASGEVPGRVLNQFSMDEYEGYFRIATTSGHVTGYGGATSSNNIYILDMDLEIVGSLEDLAPGERIYSARFMGGRAYLVTFKKVDPLFVIDLTDPKSPKVLGKLKIPGYSDYLHPYDETHIIGIGKDTVEAEEGDFAWYQGLKLALFDVSDVEHPREVSKAVIGDRGTDSYALRDHKAFLFSREKNLLVIPVLLAELDHERYPRDLRGSAYGRPVWQGAYVFTVDAEEGFKLKGRVSHMDGDEPLRGRYYYGSDLAVKRSLYMDDTLYTVSEDMVKMNDLADLHEINRVYLR
ncbi:MAG: hypothetical protein D6733_01685 [Methanobacteriota archaeon]|nr:MAG: hypothetical protein D6733_01685 [Euryarchaeota archaeon]